MHPGLLESEPSLMMEWNDTNPNRFTGIVYGYEPFADVEGDEADDEEEEREIKHGWVMKNDEAANDWEGDEELEMKPIKEAKLQMFDLPNEPNSDVDDDGNH
jgi:hypothetical protein